MNWPPSLWTMTAKRTSSHGTWYNTFNYPLLYTHPHTNLFGYKRVALTSQFIGVVRSPSPLVHFTIQSHVMSPLWIVQTYYSASPTNKPDMLYTMPNPTNIICNWMGAPMFSHHLLLNPLCHLPEK
jgi:hypothetical protein